LTAMQGQYPRDHSSPGEESREHPVGWGTSGLAGPTANLTAAIQSLTTLQKEEHAENRRTVTELPRVIIDRLHGPLNELTDAIHELTRLLLDAKHHPVPTNESLEDRPLLWKSSAYPRASSTINFFEKISSWPKRPWLSKHRPTG
ncbi:MAG: hypothetical protein OEV70_16300, partial [Nitrospirota bacterium]|nr:hypothetical protein [Nitrospirota bacterium]